MADFIPTARLISSLTRRSRVVAWDPPMISTLTGFNVYRNNVNTFAGSTKLNTTPITITFFEDVLDEKVQDFTFYYFVTAITGGGSEGLPSPPASQFFENFDPLGGRGTLTPDQKTRTSTTFSFKRITNEIRRRHNKILTFDGEQVHYLARKVAGSQTNTDFDRFRRDAPYRQPDSVAGNTDGAFGTTFNGGYDVIPNVQIRYLPTTEMLSRQEMGLVKAQTPTVWSVDFPVFQPRDVIVRKNNERFVLANIRRQSVSGKGTRQVADVAFLEPSHIIYSFPVPTFEPVS